MNTRTGNTPSALLIVVTFLVTALSIQVLGGCASTPPGTGPGSPDKTQLQHYEMLQSAIEAQSKVDALAALALLQADVSRWRVNWLATEKAILDQAAVTDAVDKEDWDLVNKLFVDLTAYYRSLK